MAAFVCQPPHLLPVKVKHLQTFIFRRVRHSEAAAKVAPERPYISFGCCLSSKTMCLCLCALIHINYFTTWAASSSRCLEIRFQCQLRGTSQAGIRGVRPGGGGLRRRRPKPGAWIPAESRPESGSTFLLHQQTEILPQKSLAVGGIF